MRITNVSLAVCFTKLSHESATIYQHPRPISSADGTELHIRAYLLHRGSEGLTRTDERRRHSEHPVSFVVREEPAQRKAYQGLSQTYADRTHRPIPDRVDTSCTGLLTNRTSDTARRFGVVVIARGTRVSCGGNNPPSGGRVLYEGNEALDALDGSATHLANANHADSRSRRRGRRLDVFLGRVVGARPAGFAA